jgi:hypothetical protein
VLPNPGKGTFTITGNTGSAGQDVDIEITDLLGQVVYHAPATAPGGKINERITLSGSIANGMYLLTIHTDTGNSVFHIVVEQ